MSAPIFHETSAALFIRRRVCARCYGSLAQRPAQESTQERRLVEVYCPGCEDAWHYTTVSLHYAIKLGQQYKAEWWEVRDNLPDLFPRAPFDSKKILSELGF